MAKADKEEAEITGSPTLFGAANGTEKKGTIIGSTTPLGGALNLADDEPVTMPTTEPIPVEVAVAAAEASPSETPWEKVVEEARALLANAEGEIKKVEGEPTDGT